MTFLEARRNRITMAFFFSSLVIVVSSFVFREVTTTGLDVIVRDVGLATIHLFGLILAVLLGSSVLSREIERKTLYMLITKPVSRASFAIGKISGVALTLLVTLGLMAGTFLLQQVVFGAPLGWILAQTCWLLFVQLVLVSCFAYFVSTFASPLVSAFMALGLFVVGESAGNVWTLAEHAESAPYRLLLRSICYLFPNLERMNLKSFAQVLRDVPGRTVLEQSVYGLIYIALFVSGAVLVFRRRDMK